MSAVEVQPKPEASSAAKEKKPSASSASKSQQSAGEKNSSPPKSPKAAGEKTSSKSQLAGEKSPASSKAKEQQASGDASSAPAKSKERASGNASSKEQSISDPVPAAAKNTSGSPNKKEKNAATTQSASSESADGDNNGKSGNGERRPRRRFNRGDQNRRAYVPYSVLLHQHEEAQKQKKVLDTSITGTVKWFSLRYHYGFIARDDGKGDVFVHQMNIAKSRMNRVYLRSLAHNEKVEFDVVEGKAGPEASNVTGPGGADVQGVYVIQLRYPLRRDNMAPGGNRRRRNTSGNNRRPRRRTENEENADGPSPQGQRRNRRRNRNRTISAAKPEALEEQVNDLVDEVGGIRVAN